MAQPSWVLLALIGATLVYEANAINCVQCNTTATAAACADGTEAAKACPKADDLCYTRIVNGVLDRGCLSVLEASVQTSCNSTTDLTCINCNAEGCNTQKWRKCRSCTETATDHACATGGTTLPSAYCKNFAENDYCFERFNAQSLVERGCQSDVPAAGGACKDNSDCNTCPTDDCNSAASTAFVTKCVQCNTGDDADESCLKGTKAQTACEKASQGSCFSRLNVTDGVLERGCKSKLTDQEVTACTGVTCDICTNTEQVPVCNNNKFPVDRAECHRCDTSGADKSCASELAGSDKSSPCKVYKANDQCYSRVLAGVFERGCQADLGANKNACQDSESCGRCVGVNCNKVAQDVLTKQTSCRQCSAASDPDCAAGTAPSESCGVEKDSCITRINANNVERKCLSQLSADDQAKCNKADDPSCVTCSDPGCNSQKWLKCHQCNETAANDACSVVQEDARSLACTNLKTNDLCFERLVNSKVERGCVSSLQPATTAPCEGNQECRTCAVDGCNKEASATLQTKDRCLQCVTSVDANGKCLDGTEQSQPCKAVSGEKCYSRVLANGDLQRGCHGDLAPEVANACNNATCSICPKAECNTGVFPVNRLKCYQCKGDSDKACLAALTGDGKSSYCKTYLAGDKCYSRIVKDIFERGCQSTLGKGVDACKDLDQKHCASCDKQNCNSISEAKLSSARRLALQSMPVMLITAVIVMAAKMF